MLSNDSTQPQASSPSDAKAGTADPVPVMKPGSPIEVASTGGTTVTDPSGKDNRPSVLYESDSSLA